MAAIMSASHPCPGHLHVPQFLVTSQQANFSFDQTLSINAHIAFTTSVDGQLDTFSDVSDVYAADFFGQVERVSHTSCCVDADRLLSAEVTWSHESDKTDENGGGTQDDCSNVGVCEVYRQSALPVRCEIAAHAVGKSPPRSDDLVPTAVGRRKRANDRERRRMHLLNEALDRLRQVLPIGMDSQSIGDTESTGGQRGTTMMTSSKRRRQRVRRVAAGSSSRSKAAGESLSKIETLRLINSRRDSSGLRRAPAVMQTTCESAAALASPDRIG